MPKKINKNKPSMALNTFLLNYIIAARKPNGSKSPVHKFGREEKRREIQILIIFCKKNRHTSYSA
jgi:hypothetical protein